ncbi:MAG: M50 family metallopeptidase [Nesterenkonia sp.]
MQQGRAAWEFVTERFTVTADPDPAAVVVVAVVVVLVTGVPQIWRISRQAATIVHEMGHVFAAWLSGRRVAGIRLHSDTSGMTLSRGRPRGPGMLITALAGYPAPGLLAVGLVALAAAGQAGAALTVYQAVMVLALLLSRNLVGILSCVISVTATGVIWWSNDPVVVTYTVVALSVFYAVAGVRGTLDLWAVHLRGLRGRSSRRHAYAKQQARTTDAARAAEAWGPLALPAALWLVAFLLISLASAAAVFWLLFG